MAVQEPKWLIKTSGRVIGPFTTAEVDQKIRSRQTVAHDEITQPEAPWLFVRDIFVFKKSLEFVHAKNIRQSSEENTSTVTSASFTQSVTDAISHTIDEITPHSITPPKFIKDAVKTVTGVVSSSKSNIDLKAYGLVDENIVKLKANERSKSYRFVTLAFAFLAVTYFAYNEIVKRPVVNQATTTNEMTLAMSAIRVGESSRAFEHFRNAKESEPSNFQARVFYNLFMLHEQPHLSGQVLAGLKDFSAEDASTREFKMIKGLANIFLKRFPEAKNDFNELANSDVQVSMNLAIVNYFSGAYGQSLANLKSIDTPTHQGIKSVLVALVSLQNYLKTNDKVSLLQSMNDLEITTKSAYNWKLEAALLKAYMLHLLGRQQDFDKASYRLIEQDPDATKMHWQDPWLAHESVKATVFVEWCPRLVSSMNDSARSSILNAYCSLQIGRSQAAQKFADLALSKAPKDPLVNAWFAVIYRDSGFEGKAGEHFAKAEQYNEALAEKEKHVLPWTLQARWLEVGRDFQSASSMWNKVISRDPDSVSGLTGRARYMFETGNIAEATEFAKRATQVSSEFKPLLQLNYEIESKQKL